MAIQLDVATRNARLNTIESTNGTSCSLEIRTGAQPASCATAGSGTVLVTINLPSDWANAASSGSKTLLGTWSDASADASGTAAHFRLYNSQATKDNTTCFMQGSVTATGGGGDMTLDSTTVTATQVVTITTFTLTDANA